MASNTFEVNFKVERLKYFHVKCSWIIMRIYGIINQETESKVFAEPK